MKRFEAPFISSPPSTEDFELFSLCLGDGLPEPHYLSWGKIINPEPNFHLPGFFGEVRFLKWISNGTRSIIPLSIYL